MESNDEFLGRIRYPAYKSKIMSAEKAAEFVHTNMTLGVSGFSKLLREHLQNVQKA